ncbi:Thiosulfate sulfurtransferase rdl2 mitochondrial [Penicillium odoratum]|uniref:Thiosulfate sulfurtransferase rdl2 mitochondrial n=1 Tax=Penicillium odoratum TaxID=1167516 RepID=UPI0025465AD9|nr:Thiosulfate sulfurtransferase rdl2 mitochondrial [Penicillium odoratum]KAJ5746527.1 Thiosulfate sulfurtransferase rdl2 mitochondrial [Penicillium odoratum]
MAALPSAMRRSVATLSSKTLKAPARQIPSLFPAFQTGSHAATNRGITSLSSRRGTNALAERSTCKSQYQTSSRPLGQIRWSSNEPASLRQWGFEDINTTLPSTNVSSPTHTPILIDVREPAELTATGIIPTAICIPLASQPDALYLTADEFETRFGFPKPSVGKNQKIVFYCKAGVRARAAAQLAVQAGYDPESLGVYDGSWLDWKDKGGRVVAWEGDEF